MGNNLFEKSGKTLQVIAKVIYNIAIIVGSIGLVVGLFVFLIGVSEVDSLLEGIACTEQDVRYSEIYAKCFYGRKMMSAGVVMLITSIITIPMYAFGELVNSCQRICKMMEGSEVSTKPVKIEHNKNNKVEKIENEQKQEQQEEQEECFDWLCPLCGNGNSNQNISCRSCGYRIS